MKRFSERDPVITGVVGTVVVLACLLLAVSFGNLPLPGGTTTYRAVFAEAGGLDPGDEVTVLGTEAGRVTAVELDGTQVLTTFEVDGDLPLGSLTRAAVGTNSPLGTKAMELTPDGPGELAGGALIPLERTTSPYSLDDVLTGLTTTTAAIDTGRLAAAMNTVSDTIAGTPDELGPALQGLSRLSATVSSRDEQLIELLGNAETVTGVLAERNQELVRLMADGNLLFAELERRRDEIHELLINVSATATQLSGLAADNEDQLGPTLDQLNGVLEVLRDNRANIESILQGVGPYIQSVGESVGSGPFFDAHLANLVPTNLVPRLLPTLQGTAPGPVVEPPAPPGVLGLPDAPLLEPYPDPPDVPPTGPPAEGDR